MTELSRYLFLAGAAPLFFLGTAHAFATPLRSSDRKGLTPADPALVESMQRSRVLLTRRVDVWRAWVGFNLSHSLGALAFAASIIVVGRSRESFTGQAAFCVPLATLVAALYVAIGLKFWFRTPIGGCAVSLACFVASWATL